MYQTVEDIVKEALINKTGIGCSPRILSQKGRVSGWRTFRDLISGYERVIIEVEEEFQINYYLVRSGVIVYHGHGNIRQGMEDTMRMNTFIMAIELAALGNWLACKEFCEDNYIAITREIVLDNHLENVMGEWVD